MTAATPLPVPPATSASTSDGCRCSCGALMARLVAGGVEIRCRRCKRTHIIPLEVAPTE